MQIQGLLDWFGPDELEDCTSCGKRHGLMIEPAGAFICFGCGFIRSAGGVTSVSAIQAREKREIGDDLAPSTRVPGVQRFR